MDTYFLVDTTMVGERHAIGHADIFPVLQTLHRRGFRNVTDETDRRLGMTVFTADDAHLVFIIETAR